MTLPARIERYVPGELPLSLTPGDIGVVHDWHEDLIGQLIQAGERADVGHTAYANLTHSFLITDMSGRIVEANAPGIQAQNISKYRDADFHVISPNVPASSRDYAVRFGEAQVGTAYDVLDFVAGLVPQALFGWNISIHAYRRFICSGLCCGATECYTEHGYPKPPEAMKPADIALYWKLDLGEPPVPLGFFARLLDTVRSLARLAAAVVSWPVRRLAHELS